MPNSLSFDDISTTLNAIMKQASGVDAIAPVDTKDFVQQADFTLKTGYDRVMGAISQVLDKTVFSTRPYNRKFASLYKNSQQWGNHVRKITMLDSDFEDDSREKVKTEGATVDMYKVHKGIPIQANFYGGQTYQFSRTYFRDQLDQAFRSPEELGAFITMYTQNMLDCIEKAHEELARGCVANYIAAKKYWQDKTTTPDESGTWVAANMGGVHALHLVTMYNDETGANLTSATVKLPQNFPTFWKWAVSKILQVSDKMTERSVYYNIRIESSTIPRHTPKSKQVLYLYSPDIRLAETSVLSDVYHKELLNLGSFESVNFWQSIDSPSGINLKAVGITQPDGTAKNTDLAVTVDNVLGVLFDEEAIGYTMINEWSATTPFNARGGYSNVYYHFTDRYWNDLTEFGVVFLLD